MGMEVAHDCALNWIGHLQRTDVTRDADRAGIWRIGRRAHLDALAAPARAFARRGSLSARWAGDRRHGADAWPGAGANPICEWAACGPGFGHRPRCDYAANRSWSDRGRGIPARCVGAAVCLRSTAA